MAFDSFAGTLVNNAPVDQPAGGNFVFGRAGSIKAGAAGRAAILPGQTVFVSPPGADEAWFDVDPGFTNHGILILESALPGTPINLSTSGGAGGLGTLTNAGVIRIMPAPLQSITPNTPTNRFIYGNLTNTEPGAVTVSSPTALRGDVDNAGAQFAGFDVDENAVLLRYTYNGDADLSGEVNADDFARADRGFLSQVDADPANNAVGFHNGDFNYDERINISDFFLLDLGDALQGEPLEINPAESGPAAALPAAAASPVPEPGSLLVVGLTAATLTRRWRR